jgi:CMP-N,N'-diacetyllegionaminic acid synthase
MKNQGTKHSILGVIPARGGSKAIARKNARLLAGVPLLAYTARAALQSHSLARILISTDDPEIARIGKAEGIDVPFLRPSELALDSTPMIDVVRHVLDWVQSRGEQYEAICLLQPTSPLRTAQTIDRCISLLFERDVDSVISVRPVPSEYNPHWVYFPTPSGLLQPSLAGSERISVRQKLPPAFHCDGSVFATKTDFMLLKNLVYGGKMFGVVSPEEEACDLDTEEQWAALEQRLRSVHESVIGTHLTRE